MNTAIGQLTVVQVSLLGALAGLLGNAGYLLTLLLGFKNLLEDDIGHLRILMKQVIDLLFNEITYELIE